MKPQRPANQRALVARREIAWRTTALLLALLLLGVLLLLVPAAFKFSHDHFWTVFSRDLGIALIPLAGIALIYEYVLRRAFLTEMKSEIARSIRSHFEAVDRLLEGGIVDVEHNFQTTDVANGFAAAQRIDILQTWIPDIITLLLPLSKACASGCSVRILLLDPESPMASIRGQDLGYHDVRMTAENVRANIAELHRLCRSSPHASSAIQVKVYGNPPSLCIHRFDDTAHVGFFLCGTPAVHGPQLICRGQSGKMLVSIAKHFDALWATARAVPLNGPLGPEPTPGTPAGTVRPAPDTAPPNGIPEGSPQITATSDQPPDPAARKAAP